MVDPSSSTGSQAVSQTRTPGERLKKPSTMGRGSKEDWEDWMKWDDPDGVAESPQLPAPIPLTAKRGSFLAKKRKSLSDDDKHTGASGDLGKSRTPPGTRSHNIVEKRYRTNINQKITALRDSIPSLRPAKASETQPVETEGEPTQKFNKATVLSTAVGYIRDLEKDKRRLEIEIAQLKVHLRAIQEPGSDAEKLNKASCVEPSAASPNGSQTSTCLSTGSSEDSKPIQGMIKVPEEMRRLRTATTQIPLSKRSYIEDDDSEPEDQDSIRMGEHAAKRAKFVGKLVVGSFAGLMVMQGFGESEKHGNIVEKRGLLAVPTRQFWASGQETLGRHSLDDALHHLGVLPLLLKISVVVFICGFGVFVYAFCSKPKRKIQPQKAELAPSLASPLEVRRNAWLTAIQTVRVPRHQMFPEWAAVNLEALQYVVRHIIGWRGYSWLTGQSEDDEVARLRAWDIAIDAQLMGGDAEISGSRLILTILASGTLPRSPARLILKAIHLRILLWKASGPERGSLWCLVHRMAASLANYQWRLAQDLNRNPVFHDCHISHDVENLPEHLAALLQLSCSEALTDPIIQRAHNLAWSRPTREDVFGSTDEIDLVVVDSTIRSPHDALCAWVSSTTLQKALYAKLADIQRDSSELDWNFGIALHTASPASIAQARALAANAVFVEANHENALSMLLRDTTVRSDDGDSSSCRSGNTVFIDSSLPKDVCQDVGLATSCALALSMLRKVREEPQHLRKALRAVSDGYRDAEELTWLSFATAYHLIHILQSADRLYDLHKREIHQISSRLLSWLKGTENSDRSIDQCVKANIEFILSSCIISNAIPRVATLSADKTASKSMGSDEEAPTKSKRLSSVGEEADTTIGVTTLYLDSSSSPHGQPEMPSTKKDDRRSSYCSEDSGYGSIAA